MTRKIKEFLYDTWTGLVLAVIVCGLLIYMIGIPKVSTEKNENKYTYVDTVSAASDNTVESELEDELDSIKENSILIDSEESYNTIVSNNNEDNISTLVKIEDISNNDLVTGTYKCTTEYGETVYLVDSRDNNEDDLSTINSEIMIYGYYDCTRDIDGVESTIIDMYDFDYANINTDGTITIYK